MIDRAPPFREMRFRLPKSKQNRRRWIIIAILWMVVAYPFSEGPMIYAWRRGWMPGLPVWIAYRPLDLAIGQTSSLAGFRHRYRSWWSQLAMKHGPDVAHWKTNWREYIVTSDVETGGIGSSHPLHGESYDYVELADGEEIRFEREGKNRIFLNDRHIATLPSNARLIEIELFEGKFDLQVDGQSIPVVD